MAPWWRLRQTTELGEQRRRGCTDLRLVRHAMVTATATVVEPGRSIKQWFECR